MTPLVTGARHARHSEGGGALQQQGHSVSQSHSSRDLKQMSSQPPLTDAHGHLQADRFDVDRDEVIARLRAAGMTRLLIPSWSVASSQGAVEIAREHDWMDAAIGIHPHHATDEASQRAALWRAPLSPRSWRSERQGSIQSVTTRRSLIRSQTLRRTLRLPCSSESR